METNNVGKSRGRGGRNNRIGGSNSSRKNEGEGVSKYNSEQGGGRGRGGGRKEDEKIDYSSLLVSKEKICDIGLNLTSKSFSSDMDQVVSRAVQKNVRMMILTGTSEKNSLQSLQMAKKYSKEDVFLFSTAGVHPHGKNKKFHHPI